MRKLSARQRLGRRLSVATFQLGAQQDVLRGLQGRIGGDDRLGAGAGQLQQLGVGRELGDAELANARLAGASQLALAAQGQIDVGEAKAVGVLD